jgi:hypothetical protein
VADLTKWLVSHQGWCFFPILMLEGLSLRSEGFRRGVRRGSVERRWIELSLLTVRLGGLVALVFLVLSPGKAAGYPAVELAVFGFYLGSSFAPNHIGMPLVFPKTKIGLLAPTGPDESQHQRRTLHVDTPGRSQLPNRTPLVPLDGPRRLGHENATLVLKTYGHLMSDSEDRTRRAINDA